MTTVAVVSLGRGQAMGEVRRVASWRQLFTAAGATVVEITVPPDRRLHVDGAASVVRGDAPPERLAWSGRRLRASLAEAEPDAVIVVSTRAFDPRSLDTCHTVVLDQVDSLARSYRDRAAVVHGAVRQGGYRALAALHARHERRLRSSRVRRVAAGWSDARALDTQWVPNLVDPALSPPGDTEPDRDLLFVGTLRYPPNVDAVERLARMWPRLVDRRASVSAIIAGSAPTERVVALCDEHGWELVADFVSLEALARRARLAVAPLTRVAGIQNKVLDAASLALPQVVTKEALEGFEPGIPLVGHTDDESFAADVLRLLDDPATASTEAAAVREHVDEHYGPAAWVSWARGVLVPRDAEASN